LHLFTVSLHTLHKRLIACARALCACIRFSYIGLSSNELLMSARPLAVWNYYVDHVSVCLIHLRHNKKISTTCTSIITPGSHTYFASFAYPFIIAITMAAIKFLQFISSGAFCDQIKRPVFCAVHSLWQKSSA